MDEAWDSKGSHWVKLLVFQSVGWRLLLFWVFAKLVFDSRLYLYYREV